MICLLNDIMCAQVSARGSNDNESVIVNCRKRAHLCWMGQRGLKEGAPKEILTCRLPSLWMMLGGRIGSGIYMWWPGSTMTINQRPVGVTRNVTDRMSSIERLYS